MLSRLDFLELEKDFKRIKIYELEELYGISNSFLTYFNAMNNSQDTELKIRMMHKAESKTMEMIQIIISKINPELNWLIRLDNDSNESYKKFSECMGVIMDKIEKENIKVSNLFSNQENIISNKITNKVAIESFSFFLYKIVNNIVYSSLKEAVFKYMFLEDTEKFIEKVDEGTLKIIGEDGKAISVIYKDRNLFWYIVFCLVLRSSQVIGYITSITRIPDTKDIRRLVRAGVQAELQRLSQMEEESRETKEKQQKEKDKTLKEEKSEESKEDVESKKLINEEVPHINGASQEEFEDEDFEIGDEEDEPAEEEDEAD